MSMIAALASGPAGAADSGRVAGNPIAFDIPAQPLEAAIDAYGVTSRIQVLYETALAAGRRSSAVKGVYPPDEALRLLLSGTGLDFDYTEERAVTLIPTRSSSPGVGTRINEFSHFLGGVQAGILKALCGRPEAQPGAYRVAFQLQIDSSGAVVHPVLLSATDDAIRDSAILDSLAHLSFSEGPPAGMPQPVTMVMTPGDSCDERVR